MDRKDKEKTTFNTHYGHYQRKCMPMGLVNSVAVWQRMADTLTSLVGETCHVQLNGIILYSKTFEQHLRDWHSSVFKRGRTKTETIKCQF